MGSKATASSLFLQKSMRGRESETDGFYGDDTLFLTEKGGGIQLKSGLLVWGEVVVG